ncbi:MAG TPA: TetR/AcrR family transcriptional regulator [Corynebacterium variabile]|uniref:TetR/AcrR family transcriptional regulator n=1 Tax=Corynebacterium variabile TaxID=1727 RepID=A0A3B9QTW5_9CORY|nr:TetR/AcrR family transcriptional regulator [Corynebacterium variabile]
MSVTPPTRRRGRPAKFSAEDVIRSALAAGIGSFTQSDVALELGVTVQSVYRRFPTRKLLLEACIDRALESVPPADSLDPAPGTWEEIIGTCADQWWALCLRYPGFTTVVTNYDGTLERFLDPAFNSYTGGLIDLGWSRPQVRFAMSQIESAAARVAHYLSQAVPQDEDALEDASRQMRQATDFIVKGLSLSRPEWLL